MGGFSGVSGMINSLKSNKNLLGSKKSLRDITIEQKGKPVKKSKPLEFKSSWSKGEYEIFLKKLKKRTIVSTITLIVVILTILLILIFLIVNFL
jgi:hypothetical protein